MVLLVMLSLAGCSGGAAEGSSTTETATAPPTQPDPTPAPEPVAARPPIRITAPACGYGGSAPAVSVFVDVENDVALHGVTFAFGISSTGSDAIVGRSRDPMATAIVPPDHTLLDFSTQGTTPFDGELAAGARTRLLYWAGVDDVPSDFGAAIDVHVTLSTSDGQHLDVVCSTAEMLPSS